MSLSQLPSSKHNLDKLAQVVTDGNDKLNINFTKGTKSSDKKRISKRARSKYISTSIKRKLLKIEDSPLRENYEKSCTCASTMKVERGKVSTTYCKQRWCITCNRIKTGMLLNTYLPVIEETFKDAFFVTLTTPNCLASELRETLIDQLKTFSKIANTMKQRKRRATGEKFTAMVKAECTYNSEKDTFHPHLHAIIESEEDAQEVLSRWMQAYEDANIKAQDIRQADENSMKELLKYSTKMVSELADGKEGKEVNIKALDTMFVAMKRIKLMRTYGNMYGINSDCSDEEMEEQAEEDKQLSLFDEKDKRQPSEGCYVWMQEGTDWFNTMTGEGLTGYKPAPKTLDFIGKMRL